MYIIRLFIHKYIVLETTDKQILPKRYKARRSPNRTHSCFREINTITDNNGIILRSHLLQCGFKLSFR
ncbi:hypothetical protein BFAG_04053 [Bacteroides fragilis 3_1_12]|uniref:Uncharacterized protein n=1 Tax=Bacteroides fragilis 3_1_12 TaxID=457424 RepID=A0ABN0BR04_BACFG|nr:hypothetical protein BFAG_04053 [Bacteroides fragilis 3_1_12]